MSGTLPMADRKSVSNAAAVQALLLPHVKLGGLTLLAAAPLFAIAALVPRPLVLPAVSLTAIAAAAAVALVAWRLSARRNGGTLTLWDVAGACALIGCAAGMLSEPELVLRQFGHD
jgi:hypothetical protein